MSSIPDGSYHVYTTDKVERPIVVEVMANYVAICGEDGWRHISQCVGRYVRLREVSEVADDAKYGR